MHALQGKSPHIIHFVGYAEVPRLTTITRAYVGGSLHARIYGKGEYGVEFAVRVARQVAAGMVSCVM